MPPAEPKTPSSAVSPRPNRGHEHRDANVAWIFGLVLFLFVAGISLHFILSALLNSLKHSPQPHDSWSPLPGVARATPSTAPGPHLQISPPLDLASFRAREESKLNSYGWVNKTTGIVRVPIERAMQLVLEKGLPVRTSTNQTHAGPSPDQLIRERPLHRENELEGGP